MDSFIDRLQYYMQQKGINNNQMTVAAGLSVGLIGRAIKSKSGLNSESIEKILYAYPDVNPNWLLAGRGEMLITPNSDNKNGNLNGNPNGNLSNKNNQVSEPGIQYGVRVRKDQLHTPLELLPKKAQAVPYYNLPVSAGALGVLESNVYTTEPDGYLDLPAFDGCEAVFPVTGVSMEPLLSSGDLIGIRSVENLSRSWEFIQTDVIYLIITREDRMIKFIERATDEDYIVCKSPNAGAFKVFKGDILKLYRVRACVKKL
ncbi:S24 family peptidase [Bacteroides sp.]